MSVLKDEFTNDPLGRGYSSMNDRDLVDDLNSLSTGRTASVDRLSADSIYETLDNAEFEGLSVDKQARVRDVLLLGESIDVTSGSKVRATIVRAFGTSTSQTAFLAATTKAISRAAELGYPVVTGKTLRLESVR